MIVDQEKNRLRQLAEAIRESNADAACVCCEDLVAARAAIENLDGLSKPVDAVIVEESARAERVSSIYETLAFLRELDARGGTLRPHVYVLTQERHDDPAFAERFKGCNTYRMADVLNGSAPFDMSSQ